MKYVDEFRDSEIVRDWASEINKIAKQSWTLMEICGGQTHNIMKFGLDSLLPGNIRLIHGPGCPVCVTPASMIDAAVALTRKPQTILCSFGDMLRVPGSSCSLLGARAEGGDVRVIYSPLEAVRIAQKETRREVVLFAVGFETTAPANAAAVAEAMRLGLKNFSVIVSHVLVPPAIESILADPQCVVQGFLAAGHVCTVTGYREYHALSEKYKTPLIITGFEPVDILQGIYLCIAQLESGDRKVINQYSRSARIDGNQVARTLVDTIFEVCDREWRGIGTIPRSGLRLRPELIDFDALARLDGLPSIGQENPDCLAGAILQGKLKPMDCPAFGRQCRPDSPLGAPMVSNEGACAAYYLYKERNARHG